MVDMNLLAKRLRVARLVAGLTQQKAADMAGVSRIVVTKTELRKTTPSVYTVAALAEVYGVSLDWLFGKKLRMESNAESSGILQAPAAGEA